MIPVRVGIAELKSRLSEYLRVVRRGGAVVVLDRDTPVARLVPIAGAGRRLLVRPPAAGSAIQDVDLPPPLALPIDVVDLLCEERGTR